MCNLSLGVRENGAIDALIHAIKSLMKTTKCSFEEAIKTLEISASDEEKIKEKMDEPE